MDFIWIYDMERELGSDRLKMLHLWEMGLSSYYAVLMIMKYQGTKRKTEQFQPRHDRNTLFSNDYCIMESLISGNFCDYLVFFFLTIHVQMGKLPPFYNLAHARCLFFTLSTTLYFFKEKSYQYIILLKFEVISRDVRCSTITNIYNTLLYKLIYSAFLYSNYWQYIYIKIRISLFLQ